VQPGGEALRTSGRKYALRARACTLEQPRSARARKAAARGIDLGVGERGIDERQIAIVLDELAGAAARPAVRRAIARARFGRLSVGEAEIERGRIGGGTGVRGGSVERERV